MSVATIQCAVCGRDVKEEDVVLSEHGRIYVACEFDAEVPRGQGGLSSLSPSKWPASTLAAQAKWALASINPR